MTRLCHMLSNLHLGPNFNPQAPRFVTQSVSRCLTRDLEICPLICARLGLKNPLEPKNGVMGNGTAWVEVEK